MWAALIALVEMFPVFTPFPKNTIDVIDDGQISILSTQLHNVLFTLNHLGMFIDYSISGLIWLVWNLTSLAAKNEGTNIQTDRHSNIPASIEFEMSCFTITAQQATCIISA